MEQVLTRNLNFGFDIPTYYIMEKWSMEIFLGSHMRGKVKISLFIQSPLYTDAMASNPILSS